MNTKIIFNTDAKLKAKAFKKARSQGLTLSAMLNMATQAYVNDTLHVDIFARDLTQSRADIRAGKGIPAEALYRKLGIRK